MALPALVIAIVGSATGVVALAWQVISFRRSGWRLKVKLLAHPDQLGEPQRPGQLYYVIRITNTGRQAALVSQVTLVAESEKRYGGDSLWYNVLHEQTAKPLQIEASQQIIIDTWVKESDLPPGNIRIYGAAYAGNRTYMSMPLHLNLRTN